MEKEFEAHRSLKVKLQQSKTDELRAKIKEYEEKRAEAYREHVEPIEEKLNALKAELLFVRKV